MFKRRKRAAKINEDELFERYGTEDEPKQSTSNNNEEIRFYKDPSFLKKEKDELDKLYEEISSFENEVKAHFDLVKGSRTPGSFTFISKQTENILSLKKSKLDIIHERVSLGKIISDYEFKDISAKEKDKDKDDTARFSELFKYINSKDPVNIKELNKVDSKLFNDTTENITDINDLLDDRFDSLAKEGKVKYSNEDKAMQYETRNLITKVRILNNDGDWKFAVYDKDTGERIKNYPTESEDNYELKLVKLDDGRKVAKDVNTGESFEVVYSKKAQELAQ